MKFLETSPDIPTDLIREVNDGGVVFLCGAGVSKDAGLPLFQQLTDDVYVRLGESKDNEAAERIAYGRAEYDRVLRSLEKRTLLPGMDSRVRTAVSDLLAVPKGADLSRHLSILQLSRDKMGRPRLLTTNFDTLFERAAEQSARLAPSHSGRSLPRPGGPRDHGILHLHGRLADPHLGLEETDLILTSADFGDAYLRDGWASRYVEDRMRVNTLVLVGYKAEDAALRLLLETLDADRDRFSDLKHVYALEKQSDGSNSQWKAKGIKPIEFTDYGPLYETLAVWANYASDPAAFGRKRVHSILKRTV